ncbi:B-cell antigen receptor complex-associated protein beta chain [Menidia menidia]
MRWILAGCWVLALVSLSVALQLKQRPRVYRTRTNRPLSIFCLFMQHDKPKSAEGLRASAQWYKANKYNGDKETIPERERYKYGELKGIKNGLLHLYDVETKDSGVYFCKVNGTFGPGTEVQIFKSVDLYQALYRSKIKDGLMVLQGLLLAVCIGVVLLRKDKLFEKEESNYEEPEIDHIYEGLAIETCDGGLYEDLAIYAQAEGAEAPWE